VYCCAQFNGHLTQWTPHNALLINPLKKRSGQTMRRRLETIKYIVQSFYFRLLLLLFKILSTVHRFNASIRYRLNNRKMSHFLIETKLILHALLEFSTNLRKTVVLKKN